MPVRVIVGIWCQVALCPQTGSHAICLGIVCEIFQVGDVGRYRCQTRFAAGAIRIHAAGHIEAILTIACAITIVRQEEAKRNVIVLIFIQYRACGIFIGICHAIRHIVGRNARTIAVQCLSLLIGLDDITGSAVLICHIAWFIISAIAFDFPFCSAVSAGIRPCVTVIRVQMAKIESIHRQQRRISGYLEVSLQQILRYAASIVRI